MKNEVINSFAEGLVSDLNELNTPNKVMTDALNATLITFNGNEFSLQNDMGNAKVGTAYLPKGYVPVGMKEHGGIIYVASHNPETGRGQIGCFPSPQELWSDEDGEIAEIEINFTKLLGFEGNLKYLQVNNEFYRENIFLDKATQKPKIFHPGDRFIITCGSLNDIAELLSEGVLTLKLASVGTDGVLNYIDNSKLNIYKNGTFIYTGSEDVKDLLKNNEYVQVFPGTSSGKLMLIVEYNIYDTFDLSWSFDNTTGLKAIFKGSTTGNLDYAGLYNLNNGEVSTHKPGTPNTEPVINITPNNNIINYNIAPYSNYGIVKRLIRNGSIDVSNLTEKGSVDQWSYFVGNDYIDITWSFQYLDINGKEAQSMRFVFIPLDVIDNIIDNPNNDESINIKNNEVLQAIKSKTFLDDKEWYNIELEKASYNGNFDEHILFIDGEFEKNKKYVCRIDKKINNIWSAVGYEYVYTSTFFNNISAEQIKSYKEKGNRPKVTLTPEFNIKESTTETVSYYKTQNTTGEILKYKDVTYLDSLTTINPTSDIYRFRSGVHKKYNTKLNIEYIGINADLQNKLAAESLIPTYEISTGINSTLNTELNYSSTSKDNPLISELANLRESSSYKDSLNINNTPEEINLEFDIYRDIYAKGSAIKTKVFNDVEYLAPLSETLLSNYRGKNLSCIGMNDSRTRTGILISNNTEHNSHDEGAEVSNSSATQATLKEAVTSSGDNIINFVTGIGSKNVNPNYDEASLLFFSKKLFIEKLGSDSDIINKEMTGWPTQGGAKIIARDTIQENREYTLEGSYPEIDAADNFLIPSWKADNGEHYLLNLITKKNEEIYSGKKRVDTVLRCILSQLLVVQKGKRELNYLTPDSENFIYHVNSPTNININIPITCTFTDDEGIYKKWENATQVQNYLPEIEVQNKTLSYNITKEETVESTNLIALYLDNSGSSLSLTAPHPDLNDTTDEEFKRTWRKYIYLGEVNSISPDGTCNITTDDYGVVQLYKNSNHGIASNIIYNWSSNKEEGLTGGMLNTCDINKTFITSTAIDGTWGSEITEETKVYLNSDNITDDNIALGFWLYGGDHNAKGPVLASGTYFGSKSMFKESF